MKWDIRALISKIKRFFIGPAKKTLERYEIYISGTTAICPVCSGFVKVKDGEIIKCNDCSTRYKCVDQGINPRSLIYEVEETNK